ncbi:hypothetical protein TKK_0016559 [Trichogramma kaykai]
MQYLDEEDKLNTFEARTQDNVRRETAYSDKQNRTQDNVRRETAYSDKQNRTQDNVRRETAYKDEQNRTQDNVRREIAYKDEQNRTQDNVRREIAYKDEQNRTQDNVRREIAYKDEQNRTQDNVRREIAYKDEQNRTQDNVRREIPCKDEQYRTQDNVRREITCELEEQIATYKEQEYRVSAELNEGRVEPSQQIDKQKENSRPSAGASRRGIELLCDQLKECNAYLRASREIHKAGKGRDNERMPRGTEKINKSNNNELADKKEKPSTKETECIEKKERCDEETTCEDNSSQTNAAIHCIEGNIRNNDVRGDATPRSEEPASDEYNYGKPWLPSDEEWNKYYEIFGKSLNSYEADYDDINDVCECTDSHDKIKAEQSECEFIGHLDEYGDEHLEDFYGKLNITEPSNSCTPANETRHQRLDKLTLSVKSKKDIAMFPNEVPPPPRAPEDEAGAENIQAPIHSPDPVAAWMAQLVENRHIYIDAGPFQFQLIMRGNEVGFFLAGHFIGTLYRFQRCHERGWANSPPTCYHCGRTRYEDGDLLFGLFD